MKIVVAIIAALSLLAAGFVFMNSQSAVHEILAAILLICFVVCVVGLAVIALLEQLVKGQAELAQLATRAQRQVSQPMKQPAAFGHSG